jgi:hypothetical protein
MINRMKTFIFVDEMFLGQSWGIMILWGIVILRGIMILRVIKIML